MTVDEFVDAMDNGIEVTVTMKNIGKGHTLMGVKGNPDVGRTGLITVLEMGLAGLTGIDEEKLCDTIRNLMDEEDSDNEVKSLLDELFGEFGLVDKPTTTPEPTEVTKALTFEDAMEGFMDFIRHGKEEDIADFKKFLREVTDGNDKLRSQN